MKTMGYSLWFMPEGEVYKKFSGVIADLSREYSSPKFKPHITLIGQRVEPEEEIIEKTEKLSFLISPFKLRLTTIDYQDYYFRALFVKVEKTEELLEANKKAKEIFQIKDTEKYLPHLSLIYGNFPESLKKKIIQEIGQDFSCEFQARSIHLFKTDGGADAWKIIKQFSLKF